MLKTNLLPCKLSPIRTWHEHSLPFCSVASSSRLERTLSILLFIHLVSFLASDTGGAAPMAAIAAVMPTGVAGFSFLRKRNDLAQFIKRMTNLVMYILKALFEKITMQLYVQ